MKKVIVMFGLVCVSLLSLAACDGEGAYDEIEMDLDMPTSALDEIDDDEESGDPTI